MHGIMRLSGGNLHRHSVPQQLIGAQVGLIKAEAGSVGGGQNFLQRGGDVRTGIAATFEACREQFCFDTAVVRPLVPVAQVALAEKLRTRLVGKQLDDAVLRAPFGTWLLRHEIP